MDAWGPQDTGTSRVRHWFVLFYTNGLHCCSPTTKPLARCFQNSRCALPSRPVGTRSPILHRQPEEDQRPVHGECGGAACLASPASAPRGAVTTGLLCRCSGSTDCRVSDRNEEHEAQWSPTHAGHTCHKAFAPPVPSSWPTCTLYCHGSHPLPSGPCPMSSYHGGLSHHSEKMTPHPALPDPTPGSSS